jgi:hypothetical protein
MHAIYAATLFSSTILFLVNLVVSSILYFQFPIGLLYWRPHIWTRKYPDLPLHYAICPALFPLLYCTTDKQPLAYLFSFTIGTFPFVQGINGKTCPVKIRKEKYFKIRNISCFFPDLNGCPPVVGILVDKVVMRNLPPHWLVHTNNCLLSAGILTSARKEM